MKWPSLFTQPIEQRQKSYSHEILFKLKTLIEKLTQFIQKSTEYLKSASPSEKITYFLFPKACLHCSCELYSKELLCEACSSHLELLTFERRCPRCFSPPTEGKRCLCTKKNFPFDFSAYCFADIGPAKTLLAEFSRGNLVLATPLASYLFLQFHRLGWPTPDIIAFEPASLLEKILDGPTPISLVAQRFAALLKRPLKNLFCKNITFYDSSLVRNFPEQVSYDFLRMKKEEIKDKTILLIALNYRMGSFLEVASLSLREGQAKQLFLLSVCGIE
jgi:predicted amidophosphoribosyltransferase